MNITIRVMQPNDWPEVQAIYREGIKTGQATFDQQPPNDWYVCSRQHFRVGRWVALLKEQVLGWVMLTPISSRCAYQGVAEVSIYVSEIARGQKVGSTLFSKLIEDTEKHRIWMLQSHIFPENTVSIGLHRKMGFREVGVREKIGQHFGRWRDVLLMERRSQNIY